MTRTRSAAVLVAGLMLTGLLPASAGAAATKPVVTTSATTNLQPNQPITFTVTSLPPGIGIVAVECTIQALTVGEDACGDRRNTFVLSNASGTAHGSLDASTAIQTAIGTVDCAPGGTSCLFGLASVAASGGVSVLDAAKLTFASAVHEGAPTGTSATSAVPPLAKSTVRPSGPVITTGRSVHVHAGVLAHLGTATGPSLPSPVGPVPKKPVTGQGIVELTLDAPGTSWEHTTDRAVVVDVSVDGGPPQQIVCFAGAAPFTYAGFTGALTTGTHSLDITVDRDLSNTPSVQLVHAQLGVVPTSSPTYDAVAYAPIVYGRPDTAQNDTPLLTYVDRTGGGLSYTSIWSKEAAGTSFIPFLEWGEWGRMTDITTTAVFPHAGSTKGATYNTCGCKGLPATINEVSLEETEVPFTGAYFDGTHPALRNASGNDYQLPTGTSPFRVQQVPVPGRATRDAVMDAHPWTYLISAQECARWYTDTDTSPTSAEIGTPRQYAIVAMSSTVHDVSATAVDIRLSGSSRWYASDDGTGYALADGGQGRTAVKLPVGWEQHRITGLRFVSYGPKATHVSVHVLGLSPSYTITRPALPKLQVVAG